MYSIINLWLQLHTKTDKKFRDPSAWYHIVLNFDTTTAQPDCQTGRNVCKWRKIKDLCSYSLSFKNHESNWNNTAAHYIAGTSVGAFNGLMADVQFVDGQALAPTDFGETRSSDGVWVPKEYTFTR